MGKIQSILCITCMTQFKPEDFPAHKETCGKGKQVKMSDIDKSESEKGFGRFQKKAIESNAERDAKTKTKKPKTKKPKTKKDEAEKDNS